MHKGEIFKDVFYRYCQVHGISLTALAKKAGYDQSTPYRHFDQDDLQNHIILRWGKAMGHDFRKEFPELAADYELISEEDKEAFGIGDRVKDLEQSLEHWKKKYMDLLERHNELLMDKLNQKG
jgi:AcrR family transcriptional regulator